MTRQQSKPVITLCFFIMLCLPFCQFKSESEIFTFTRLFVAFAPGGLFGIRRKTPAVFVTAVITNAHRRSFLNLQG